MFTIVVRKQQTQPGHRDPCQGHRYSYVCSQMLRGDDWSEEDHEMYHSSTKSIDITNRYNNLLKEGEAAREAVWQKTKQELDRQGASFPSTRKITPIC